MDERPVVLLSIDFEDWHQLVHRRFGLADWNRPNASFAPQVHALLDLLDEVGARATFFFLGMTAANYPELVREIATRGHEPASHGFAHMRVYAQTQAEFHADVERSIEVISQATGRRPLAYRAPAFSINRRTPWAYEVLAELGFRCDSSQYDSPRVPDRIGAIPPSPYRLRLEDGQLWEFPVATWGRMPIGGGSYWRLLPARVLAAGLRADAVLYFHPYEFGGEPLRASVGGLRAAALTRWRNAGRDLVARRLRYISRHYRLVSYDQVYDDVARRHGTSSRALSPEGVLVRPSL
jgi:polysaccharide deacetylase family protein (PEP-CTERM system associated)